MSILGAVAAAVLFVLRAVLILLGVVLALALLGLVIPFCADVAWEGDPEGETDGTLEVRAGALGLTFPVWRYPAPPEEEAASGPPAKPGFLPAPGLN